MVREDMVRCARLIGEAKLLYSVDSDDAANERMDEAIRLLEMPSAEAARLRDYRARKKREQEEAAATATAATTAAPSSPAAATAPTTGVRTRTEDKTYTMGRADLERHWGDTKP